jgi:hypothetical protein
MHAQLTKSSLQDLTSFFTLDKCVPTHYFTILLATPAARAERVKFPFPGIFGAAGTCTSVGR